MKSTKKIKEGKFNDRPLTVQEFKEFRGAIGKLNWLQESTRPDLSYDTLSLSMKNRCATVGDLKKMNKVIRKAKEGANELRIHYKKIHKFENLQIHGYANASYRTQDGNTTSIKGRILFLTNEKRASPILWKSKKIS